MTFRGPSTSAICSALSVSGLAVLLAGCVSLGGGDVPDTLVTLTPETSVSEGTARTANIAEAVTIDVLETDRKLDFPRIAVKVDDSSIAYLKDATLVDKPERLFRSLLAETIAAKTGRLVLDPVAVAGRSDNRLSGRLVEFGLDAPANEVVVIFDAVRHTGDMKVEKRRFEARQVVYDHERGPVGAALNRAANMVAADVAAWIG